LNTQRVTQLAIVLTSGLIAFSFSQSIYIAIAFSSFVTIFQLIAQRKSESARTAAIQSGIPELIDILISGVQSGLSLNESLAGMADRGPEIFKDEFKRFNQEMRAHGDFRTALIRVKESLAEPNVDQVVEALLISRELGGAELLNILRLLSKFIREDLTLRREIVVKQSWIKNSAHLSAAAPWLLLLLLSTQPSTSEAFSTSGGVLILISGLGLTAIAYLWMNHLSKMPYPNRIFIDAEMDLAE
jgi:tight adherence protein B